MNKKKYVKPIVLIEDMECADIMQQILSDPTTDNNLNINKSSIHPDVTQEKVEIADSKESDWSFDYSLDLDW